MDSLGEVGKKMRSAIKAKLVELGNASPTGYIDDELPDYVMIMVANKRSKQQMLTELNLFLGSNTETFVNWLHQVLQKLQEVTLPSNLTTKAKKKIGESSSKKDKKKDKKKPKEPSITDVIAVELMEKAKKTIDPKVKCEKSEKSSRTPSPPPAPQINNDNNDNRLSSAQKDDVVAVSTVKSNAVVLHRKELAHLGHLEKIIEEKKKKCSSQNDSGDQNDQDDELMEPQSPKNNINNVQKAPVKTRLGEKQQVENSKPSNIISLSAIRKSETEFLKKIVVKQKEDNDRKIDDYRSVRNRSGRAEITTSRNHRRDRRSRSTSRDRHHRNNRERVRRRSRSRSPIKMLENRSRPSIRERIGERMASSSSSSNKHSKTPETDGNFRVKQRPALSSTITAHAGKSLLLRAMADAQRSTQASSESKKKHRDNIVVQVKNEKRNRHQNDEEYVPESISGHSESEAEYHPSYKSQETMEDDGDVIYLNNNEDVDLMDDLEDNNEITEQHSPKFTVKLPNKEKSKSPTPPLYIKRKTPVKDRIGPRSLDNKNKDDRPRKRSIQDEEMEVEEECESQRAYNLVKKTRVSPIKFDLTDDEDRAKSRSSSRDRSEKKSLSRNDSNGDAKRIKLDASRSFDHIPALLSSVAVPVPENSKPPQQVIKSTERCKFYPNCSNTNCIYYHPTLPCKSFPNCKFGDAYCAYIHPKCKFDLSCKRIDCNYYHSPGIPASTPIVASSIVPVQNYKSITIAPNNTLCRFFPNCTNSNCNWQHPKICKFGKNCANKFECNFYHFETSSKNKFKWVSPLS